MRRLLWALALAVPLAACGDDGVDELGDVDAAIAAPRPHDDDSCFAAVSYDEVHGWEFWAMPDGVDGGGSEYRALDGVDAAGACAAACAWEDERCEGGARETCGISPLRDAATCADAWEPARTDDRPECQMALDACEDKFCSWARVQIAGTMDRAACFVRDCEIKEHRVFTGMFAGFDAGDAGDEWEATCADQYRGGDDG